MLQADKSEFLWKKITYLGHFGTPAGIKPKPDKIIVINHKANIMFLMPVWVLQKI